MNNSYNFTTDDQLITDVALANFASARFGQHDQIDLLWDFCSKNGKRDIYQKGIDASFATFGGF